MNAAIEEDQFRETLARFASGVVVVTAPGPGGPVGFTASAFASVSLDPPLILVCVGKASSTHAAVVDAPLFGVNVLGDEQEWIARQFAKRGIERFAGVPLRAGAPVPILRGALAHLVCRHHGRHEAGDHTILVGEVVESATAAGGPLVHYSRGYGGFSPRLPRPGGVSVTTGFGAGGGRPGGPAPRGDRP